MSTPRLTIAEAPAGITVRQAAESINNALRYLENMERAARLRNNRTEYQILEESWLTIHEAFYGVFSLPRFKMPETPRPVASVPVERPKWRDEIESRPMKRIIETYQKRGSTVYVLECGHDVTDICPIPGEHPKRRRCKRCPPVKKKRKA